MPAVEISLLKGRPGYERRAICRSIQAALKDTLGIRHDAFHHRIHEYDEADILFPPEHSRRYILVELDLWAGRDAQTKLALFRAIEERLEQHGIGRGDMTIVCRETPPENWYLHGRTGSEVLAELRHAAGPQTPP
jgi:phenylpyruvate tautomerase PptA (4-oxalocrotonate tautomerase family)